VCPSHGYLKGEQPDCPECRQATEVYSRIVGYLRPVNQWNDGKQAEYRNRRPYEWRRTRPMPPKEDPEVLPAEPAVTVVKAAAS
ncbi:MAG TPA: anaerobic ribonucleoside-triphosphate reductase, partial [Desulfosarcina sp.]|nr:anaerobic ribonucleoside-triphosphate reductase [Desulfosarcina sp.]